MQGGELPRPEPRLSRHDVSAHQIRVVAGGLVQRKKEHSGGKPGGLGMEERIVSKDQLPGKTLPAHRAGDQGSGVTDGTGRMERTQFGCLQVGKAPRLIGAGRRGKGREKLPGLLLVIVEPLGPITLDWGGFGEGC